MILIVGLGNPGKKYPKTRHNAGFMTVDNLQLTIDKFSDWKSSKKLKSLIAAGQMSKVKNQKPSQAKRGEAEDETKSQRPLKIILAKPQTFMNNSGVAVKKLIKNLKIKIKNLIVLHDDIDLPLSKIRIVKNRGAGGHKGVESIIRELKTKNFARFRVGICPKSGKPRNSERFVLQNFTKEEEKVIRETIKKTAKAVEFCLKEGLERTMSEFNK